MRRVPLRLRRGLAAPVLRLDDLEVRALAGAERLDRPERGPVLLDGRALVVPPPRKQRLQRLRGGWGVSYSHVNRIGSAGGIGPARHVNILTTAGGCFKTPGDYLYRTQEGFQLGGGLWGIFRVTPEKTPHPLPARCVVK